jgi:hypothetical protein
VSADRKGADRSRRSAESWTAEDRQRANAAKHETLRRRLLERRAHARGVELRHTAYGYALIDTARKRIDDRNDLTLDDVESWLGRS